MEIRRAKAEELEAIIEIEKECFPESEAAKEDQIRKRFEYFGDKFVVAIKDNKVVGLINGCCTDKKELPDKLYHDVSLHKPNGLYQTVFGLEVLPKYRNMKIASQLMNHFIYMSKADGKEGIVLTCKDYLVQYYEKFGFENQGVSQSSHGGSKWNDMVLIFDKEK